jgi:hypothetical protein
MNEIQIQIEKLATLLFASDDYKKFITYIENNQLQSARLMIEEEMDLICGNTNFEFVIANKLSDFVMDLIINQIDGSTKNKQVISTP